MNYLYDCWRLILDCQRNIDLDVQVSRQRKSGTTRDFTTRYVVDQVHDAAKNTSTLRRELKNQSNTGGDILQVPV
jgi:hypothetical protein